MPDDARFDRVLCAWLAALQQYWPDETDARSVVVAAASEVKLGPFGAGSIVVLSVVPAVPAAGGAAQFRVRSSPAELDALVAAQAAVPAEYPTLPGGVHAYRIRGGARYLYVHNVDAANAIIVSALRGDDSAER